MGLKLANSLTLVKSYIGSEPHYSHLQNGSVLDHLIWRAIEQIEKYKIPSQPLP